MLNRRNLLKTAVGVAAACAGAARAADAAPSQSQVKSSASGKTPLNVLLFEGFETIDAMGPVEMLAYADVYDIRFYGLEAGVVKSAQGVPVAVDSVADADPKGLLLLPGAAPAWLKLPPVFFERVKALAERAPWVLTVCTGSVLLGRTRLLDGRKATTKKNAIPMALKTLPAVAWQKSARWCVDEKFYTSSGITAGMDMALGFIADRFGVEKAEAIAKYTEYVRSADPTNDPFAR